MRKYLLYYYKKDMYYFKETFVITELTYFLKALKS